MWSMFATVVERCRTLKPFKQTWGWPRSYHRRFYDHRLGAILAVVRPFQAKYWRDLKSWHRLWRYSTYSFHESLLLAPDMRDLRRLSRQYGIPWEEVHNVKRQGAQGEPKVLKTSWKGSCLHTSAESRFEGAIDKVKQSHFEFHRYPKNCRKVTLTRWIQMDQEKLISRRLMGISRLGEPFVLARTSLR